MAYRVEIARSEEAELEALYLWAFYANWSKATKAISQSFGR